MAAIVTGILRLLQPALSAISQRQGAALWYGLLGIRLVAIFVADGPWSTIKDDFTCNQTISDFCRAACFNQLFDFPFSALWSFSFVASLVPVVLLKTSSAWITQPLKGPDVEMVDRDTYQNFKDTSTDSHATTESAHKGPSNASRLLPYILCCLLLLVLEGVFLALLIFMQLPRIHPGVFVCRTSRCPLELECVLYSQMEKLMAVVTLIFTSAFIFGTCLVYLINLLINCIRKV